MNPEIYINGFVSARYHKISRNGNLIYEEDQTLTFGDFSKTIYKSLGLNYMKFYKMDNLCKIAFLSAEILLSGTNFLARHKPEDTGIILINSASSLETDIKFQETINDKTNYFPNPSLFVYTLANIMIGEISIKNNLKGENALLLFDNFDAGFLTAYIENLFIKEKIRACIGGYIDYNPESGGHYDSFIFWAEQFSKDNNDLQIAFNSENINNLYYTGRI